MEEEQIEIKLTDNEKRIIQERRMFNNINVENEKARKIAVISDSTYDGFTEKRDKARTNLRSVLLYKRNLDQNAIDVMKGSTDRKMKDGVTPMTMNDIEMESILASVNLSNYMSNLRKAISLMYQYIGMKKLDDTEIITEEQWEMFVDNTNAELNKVGLDLYKEKAL
jgi:hypothetical protein